MHKVDEIPKDQLDSKDKLSRQSIINHTNNQDKIYYQIKKEINDEIDTVNIHFLILSNQIAVH